MIQRYLLILISSFTLFGCADSGPDCSFATDTVSIIDQKLIGNQNYFLVHRISGWHDKIESFELYDTEPAFDICGVSTTEPLYGESVDNKDANNANQYIAHIFFEPPDKFLLEYTGGEIPRPDYYQGLRLELRN
ncbi:hypothetical protein [Hahella ganghwensis]|uniref:hypothetical protein n=1 Tax=Hahella ganghwensis TaxID=286420 RepID=UPI000525C07C|nr:hypothetical protein [Hahella ganghwensis]